MERIPASVVTRCFLLVVLSALGAGRLEAAEGIAAAFARPVAWQIALEREGFSPGIVDGKPGAKTELATREFQKLAGLPATGKLDEATAESLRIAAISPFQEYLVQAADLENIAAESNDWNEKAAMSFLGYYSPLDALAEKFHTSKRFLAALNPGVAFESLKPGATLLAPSVLEPARLAPKSLRVDLGKKAIFLLDDAGKCVGLFHCSIAANVAKRPNGETTVSVVAPNPNYTFNPEYWPEVRNVTRTLLIPPGPRNPVGVYWVGLNLPGYGMHGTPIPENIGKTGSHGCFRLANWDAVRLGKSVRVGMKVSFVSSESAQPAAAPHSTTRASR